MEPEGSLPHSQEPATCPHPEPDKSNPRLPLIFLKIYQTLSFRVHLGLARQVFASGFHTISLLPMRTAHHSRFNFASFSLSNSSRVTVLGKLIVHFLLILSSLPWSSDRLCWHSLCRVLLNTEKCSDFRSTGLHSQLWSRRSRFAKVLAKLECGGEAQPTTRPPGDDADAQSTPPTPPFTTIITFRSVKAKQSNMTIDGNSVDVVTSLWSGLSGDGGSNRGKRRDFVSSLKRPGRF